MKYSYWKEWIPVIITPRSSTLAQVKSDMVGDEMVDFLVMLFENPSSPFCLSGATTLFNHDCLHIMLRRGLLPQDEAFVIGFSMGTDDKTKWYHVAMFKFISRFIYSKHYKLSRENLKAFDLGFEYAKSLKLKNLHKFNFKANQHKTIDSLSFELGIFTEELNCYREIEKEMIPNSKESLRLNKLKDTNILF